MSGLINHDEVIKLVQTSEFFASSDKQHREAFPALAVVEKRRWKAASR